MQTPATAQPSPTPPASPAPPAPPPPPPGATVQVPVVAPGAGPAAFQLNVQELPVPRTEAEVSALRSRGSELSRQLNSAQGRRDEIARELRRADGADRAGLEQRLQLLDARILTIETDIAANGRLLAAAPPNLIQSTAQPDRDGPPLGPGQMTGVSIVFTLFVLAPIALAYARRIWRRSSAPAGAPPALLADNAQRLERMEQAVDAIAIEVERVAESQRFLTRILTEQREAAVLPPPARPEPVPAVRDGR